MKKKTTNKKLILPKLNGNFSDRELLEAHCTQLMEHFDTVQIIITKHDPVENETVMNHYGKGNSWANEAAVKHWLSCRNISTPDLFEGDDDN